jgi:hypothetical protein
VTMQTRPPKSAMQHNLYSPRTPRRRAETPLDGPDWEVWRRLDDRLTALRHAGARDVSVLDAGSGTATWLWRFADRALALGFETITLQSIHSDASTVALIRAVMAAFDEPSIRFCAERRDIAKPLPFRDRDFDVCLCLDGALNRVTPSALSRTAAELCRVTASNLLVTVRTIGGPRAESVEPGRQARNLFNCEGLRALFAPHLAAVAMAGIDLFGGRFAVDETCRVPLRKSQEGFAEKLAWLEQNYASDPDFIDRAASILLTGEVGPKIPPRQTPKRLNRAARFSWILIQ